MAQAAGHDIDYIGLAGALWKSAPPSVPVPPLNLVGDFGGGGMLLAFGVLAALVEAKASGRGQVVDAAMVDGAAPLMTMIYSFSALGRGTRSAASTCLDSRRPSTRSTRRRTASTSPWARIEAKFYAELLEGMGLTDDPDLPARGARSSGPP